MKTDKELIEQTNALALDFAKIYGYNCLKGFKFYKSTSPNARLYWNLACIAQLELCETDMENIDIDEIEELEGE